MLQRRCVTRRAAIAVAFLRRRRRLVVALDRLALAIEHAAHRVQRLDLAAGREELVQLRHRVRTLVDRAQDQRRIAARPRCRPACGSGRRALADRPPCRRAPWPGCRNAPAHRSGARVPWLRPSELPGVQRLPLPRVTVTGESSTQLASEQRVRLRQRQQVHERLEQRTDRALRFDRAVEAGLAEIAAADHRHARRRCARRSPPAPACSGGRCLLSSDFSVRVTAPSA